MGRKPPFLFVVLALALSFTSRPALAAPGVTIEDASAEEGLGTQTLHRIRLKVTSPDAVAGGFTIPWATHDVTAMGEHQGIELPMFLQPGHGV